MKANIIDQWNRIQIPEVKPCIFGQIICNKDVKIIRWKQEQSFKQMVLRKLDIHIQKNGIGPLPYTIYEN